MPAAPPLTVPVPGTAEIIVTVPGLEFQVEGGPYTVPISINAASQVSTMTITLTYNPTVLRVRAVEEGSFLRQGSLEVAFTQQVDPVAGRIDIGLRRIGDSTGASGSGLLAAILFEAVAPGSVTLTAYSVAMTPAGLFVPTQSSPVTVTVR